jgi:MFS family permease
MWVAALPLLAASLTRDPRIVSLLEVAAGLPWLLFGLLAGVLADRWDKANLMWRSDLVRLVIVGLITVLVAVHAMTIPVLLVLVFGLGTVATLFSSTAPALLPSLVPKNLLGRANARLAGAATAGRSFVGPVAGSLVFGVVAWAPFLADAFSFGVSAWCVRQLSMDIRVDGPARRPIRFEAIDGLKWILSTSQMQVLAGAAALLSIATGAFLGIFVLFAIGPLHLPPAAYGVLISLYAAGGVAGSTVAGGLIERLGLRWASALSAALGAAAFVMTGLIPLWPLTAGMLGLLGVATMLWNVTTVTLRQQLTPEHLLGRVSGAFGVIAMGGAAVGALAGGTAASYLGLPAVIVWAGALCAAAAVLAALFLPDIEPATKRTERQPG